MSGEEKIVEAQEIAFTVFDGEGHLSDEAVACVADGEGRALGPGEMHAMAHLELCEACGHRMGEAALASMALTEALEGFPVPEARPVHEASRASSVPVVTAQAAAVAVAAPSSRPRRPLPWVAIAAALLVAVVSGGPSFVAALRGFQGTIAETLAVAPFVGRVALSVARAPWWDRPLLVVIQLVSGLAFLAVGVRIARATSQAQVMEEGGVG